MTNVAVLAVREIITCGWTQGRMAKDLRGVPVPPDSSLAVCFCIVGALHRAVFEHPAIKEEILKLELQLREYFNPGNTVNDVALVEWNDADYRTQAEVLALLDKFVDKEPGNESQSTVTSDIPAPGAQSSDPASS